MPFFPFILLGFLDISCKLIYSICMEYKYTNSYRSDKHTLLVFVCLSSYLVEALKYTRKIYTYIFLNGKL